MSFMVAELMLLPSAFSYDKCAISRILEGKTFPVAVHFFATVSSGNPSISARFMCCSHDGPNRMVLLYATSVHTVRQTSCMWSLADVTGQLDLVRRSR